MQHEYLISLLSELNKAFGIGSIIFGIIAVIGCLVAYYKLSTLISQKLSTERYEKEQKEHTTKHENFEKSIDKKLDNILVDVATINGFLQASNYFKNNKINENSNF